MALFQTPSILFIFSTPPFFPKRNALKKHQSGNKKGHSVKETLSVLLTDHLFKAIDEESCCHGAY